MNKAIAIIAGEPNSISSEIIFKSWKLKNHFAHKPWFVIGSIRLLNLQKKKIKISNRDKKKILFLLNKYKKINIKELLDEQKLVKLAYLDNTEEIIDLLVFSTFVSKEIDFNTVEKCISFLDKLRLPVFPITADYLKLKYNFSESKELGLALKKLEQSWIDNDFIIDKKDIKTILKLS